MQHVFSFWQKCHETTIVYSLQQSLTTLQTQFAGIEQVHNVYNWNYGPDSGLIHYWVYVCQSTSIFITFFRGLTGLTILPFGLPIQPSPERERETDLKLLGSVPPWAPFRCNLSIRVTFAVFIPATGSTVVVQCFEFEDVVGETVRARFPRKASGRRVGHNRWTAQNFTMSEPNIVESLQIKLWPSMIGWQTDIGFIWFTVYHTHICMIWYDMICYDMIWYDIWYDMIWYMIWYDIWYDMIWHDMTWHDMIWCDVMWYDMGDSRWDCD